MKTWVQPCGPVTLLTLLLLVHSGRSQLYNITLAGGANMCQGRVEIFVNGQLGTVCDSSWGFFDAQVVCRQLGSIGCGPAEAAHGSAFFGEGDGPIHLSVVNCVGNETFLSDCPANAIGNVPGCEHDDDASVICTYPVTTTPLPTTTTTTTPMPNTTTPAAPPPTTTVPPPPPPPTTESTTTESTTTKAPECPEPTTKAPECHEPTKEPECHEPTKEPECHEPTKEPECPEPTKEPECHEPTPEPGYDEPVPEPYYPPRKRHHRDDDESYFSGAETEVPVVLLLSLLQLCLCALHF